MVTLFFSQNHKHCFLLICIANIHLTSIEKLLEDTKGVIRSVNRRNTTMQWPKEKGKKTKKSQQRLTNMNSTQT